MPTVTLVSNGHGEDAIGAALATALMESGCRMAVRAVPLVDDGAPYRALGIERLGPCRTMPSGGLTVHSLAALRADLKAGFVPMTLAQVAALGRLRSDALVVVGDIYAQVLAALPRTGFRAVVQPLVSAHHRAAGGPSRLHRYFMERISYPERALMRHLASVVYARDEATARWLRDRGVRQALALGNPMVDGATGRALPELPAGAVLALLPGTRLHTATALRIMAEAVRLVPGALGVVAWHGGPLPMLAGWEHDAAATPVPGRALALRHGNARLWVVEGRFGDVLASARLAFGTGGTANEQAAAGGLPVVSFPLEPHYGRAFLANQKRLLGDALILTQPTPDSVAEAARELLADPDAWFRASCAGRERMGAPGGGRRIAQDLLERLGWARSP